MLKRKPKKKTPKLENVGKLIAVSIVVPLLSSLAIYWMNNSLTPQSADPKVPGALSKGEVEVSHRVTEPQRTKQ